MQLTKSEKTFQVFNYIILSAIILIMLLPVWHVAMYSMSSPMSGYAGGIFLWPRNFSLKAYNVVLRNPLIGKAYLNTLFVVSIGTTINLFLTFLISYPLNKKDLRGRTVIQYFIFFTMLFSGGLIPIYLVVYWLGLTNTLWSLIIPGALSPYYIFVLRNFINTIPESLPESARIDGAGELLILFGIIIPLSTPVIAVLGLIFGVGHWNAWFNCIIYISSTAKYTLSPILRQVIFISQSQQFFTHDADMVVGNMQDIVKMATIMVATVPVLCVYPFLQKYFIKGIMLGSIKG